MQATEILMAEHRVIEKVLDTLESAVVQMRQGKDIRPGFFLDAADFVKGFADGCHHVKEEKVLFTSMADHGVPVQGGPVGVMLSDHEQGRGFIRAMRAAAERWQAGDLSARDEVMKNALGYTALLRQHIQKEDQILFPMADRVIPTGEQDAVYEGFEQVEHEETGEGVHERYLALADRLESELAG